MRGKRYKDVAIKYANDVVNGIEIAGIDRINACQRFLNDLKRDDLEIRERQADAAISLIEGIFVHKQGENLQGEPLMGKPFLLQPWQIFIIYNLLGFWYKGTEERRFKEGLIYVPRKNGKTSMVAGLSFATAFIQRKSGSKIYVVAAALKQALETFNFIIFTLQYQKIIDQFEVKNSYVEHSLKYTLIIV